MDGPHCIISLTLPWTPLCHSVLVGGFVGAWRQSNNPTAQSKLIMWKEGKSSTNAFVSPIRECLSVHKYPNFLASCTLLSKVILLYNLTVMGARLEWMAQEEREE